MNQNITENKSSTSHCGNNINTARVIYLTLNGYIMQIFLLK